MAKESHTTPRQRQARAATKQRQGRAKAEPREQAVGCGCLLVLVAVIAIIIAIVNATRHHGSGPAQAILKQISGCTNITENSGNSFDDNTIGEGSCQLSDGIDVSVYIWAAGDESDQHDYVYWNGNKCNSSYPPPLNAPDGCFVGSDPTPWFIDISTSSFAMSGAESDWAPVEQALSGVQVTKIPDSWCAYNCPIPGQNNGGGGIDFPHGE